MRIKVKEGIFKHVIKGRQGKLVCLPLYANGWCISSPAGTVKANVRLQENEVQIAPAENITKATVLDDRVEVELKDSKIEIQKGSELVLSDDLALLDSAILHCIWQLALKQWTKAKK